MQSNFSKKIVAGNQNVAYIYSASGEKLAANANGSLTYYRSVMVYGNDNMLLYLLTPEGTVSCAEGSSGTTYTYNYFKKDQVGSTRVMLSAVGGTLQQQQTTDYYPFGLAHATNNLNKNKILFSGKELQDATVGGAMLGLYDFGMRQYDALIGRWITQDPARQFFSAYVYCANNPINLVDLIGLSATPPLEDTSVETAPETIIYGGFPYIAPDYSSIFNPHGGYDGNDESVGQDQDESEGGGEFIIKLK